MKDTAAFAPQSNIHHAAKKARTNSEEGHTTTSVDIDETNDRTRPTGQKGAKRKGKGKAKDNEKIAVVAEKLDAYN